MRDQPFKRYFPNQVIVSKTKGASPSTYKNYYANRNTKLKDVPESKSQQKKQNKSITQPKEDLPNIAHLNQNNKKISIKNELQNLKLQVFKVMQKRQVILKNPIQGDLFSPKSQNSHFKSLNSPLSNNQQDFDTQSVTSEKIINEPLRKIQLTKSTQNYDHSKYVQLQNNILRNELKNLKNKYIVKKRQLNQKCDGLQIKINFLEEALSKSQEKLTVQVNNIKELIKKIDSSQDLQKKSNKNSLKRTQHPQKQENQSLQIQQKIKKLYEEISQKNTQIQTKTKNLEQYQKQNSKLKKQLIIYSQKLSLKQNQLEENKQFNQKLQQNTNNLNQKILSLNKIIQNLKNNNIKTQNQNINKKIQEKYQQKIQKYLDQLQNNKNLLQNLTNQKILIEQQNNFNKLQNNKLKLKIQDLNRNIKLQIMKNGQIQQKYQQIIKTNDNKYETLIKNIKNQYKNKAFSSSPQNRTQNKQENSISNKSPTIKKNKQEQYLTKQLKKWKLQYKILKERYQLFNTNQSNHKNQIKQYYKIAKQSKQKIQILTGKNKFFEKEFQKLKNLINIKQNNNVKLQVQMRKLSNEFYLLQNKYSRQSTIFNDKYKILEQKLTTQQQKFQKQQSYRKQLQQKLLSLPTNNEQSKQTIQRLKKRLNQQDEKISKNIKQLKTKDNLINKLKLQLRQLLQLNQNKSKNKIQQELTQFLTQYSKKTNQLFQIFKLKLQKQIQILEQNNNKLLNQLQQFKLELISKQTYIINIQNQLKQLSLSYNTKSLYTQDIITEKNMEIQNIKQQFQDYKNMKQFNQNIFNQQLKFKNEEIINLRNQVINKSYGEMNNVNFNGSFDQVLKNQIENNNKVREESAKRSQQMYKLRDNYTTLKSQYQNLKSENQINKLRFYSQKKNLDISYQVQIQNSKNQQMNLENKIGSIEKKMQVLIEQNKKKDNFIQQYIIGKKINEKQKQILNDFIKQYSIFIGSKDIIEKLMSDYGEIERLNKYNSLLLKEIALLKEKLILYEVLDVDKVSIYESRMSASHKSFKSSEHFDSIQEISPKQNHDSKLKKTISLQVFTVLQKQT